MALADMIAGTMKGEPDGEDTDEEGGDEEAQASAMGDFVAAVKGGDADAALAAFKELLGLVDTD